MEKAKDTRRLFVMRAAWVAVLVAAVALWWGMAETREAYADDGLAAGAPRCASPESDVTPQAETAEAAREAYGIYLAKHPSYKHFRIVNISDDDTPVLLCTKQGTFEALGSNFWFTSDAFIYDASRPSKVRKLGTLTTGGTACQLHYARGAIYGYRIAGLHTFAVVKVRGGRLSMSGMYDDHDLPELAWRHFSGYNPKTMGSLWESGALGKYGTKAQYDKLVSKYGRHPLKMFKNGKASRSRHI